MDFTSASRSSVWSSKGMRAVSTASLADSAAVIAVVKAASENLASVGA
jgi:hypothetical protein